MRNIEIQGHRGSRGTRSENTLASIQEAIEAEVDAVEIDLLVTLDKKIVLHHNFYLNPQLCLDAVGKKVNEDIPICSLSLDEIKRIDCGTIKNPLFPEQKTTAKASIPTLKELLDFLSKSSHPNAKNIHLNLELKRDVNNPDLTPPAKEFASLVITTVSQNHFEDRVAYSSFDMEILQEVRSLQPKAKIGVIHQESLKELLLWGKKLHAQVLSPEYTLLTNREEVEKMQQEGFRVISWTVNEISSLEKLLSFKVDGIITDYPSKMKNYLDQKE